MGRLGDVPAPQNGEVPLTKAETSEAPLAGTEMVDEEAEEATLGGAEGGEVTLDGADDEEATLEDEEEVEHTLEQEGDEGEALPNTDAEEACLQILGNVAEVVLPDSEISGTALPSLLPLQSASQSLRAEQAALANGQALLPRNKALLPISEAPLQNGEALFPSAEITGAPGLNAGLGETPLAGSGNIETPAAGLGDTSPGEMLQTSLTGLETSKIETPLQNGECIKGPMPSTDITEMQLEIMPGTSARQLSVSPGAADSVMHQRKRIQLDGLQKKFICEVKRDHPKFTAADISTTFFDRYSRELPRSTVSDVLKKSAYWLGLDSDGNEARVIRHRAVKFPAIEDSLFEWFQQVKDQGGSLTDQVLIERAKAIRDELQISESEFKVSNGWLQNFKRRHNIRPISFPIVVAPRDMSTFIKEGNFREEDVFTFSETGLYYRAPPLKALAGENRRNKNKQKDHVNVGVCVNTTDTALLWPVVVGKEARPRCFGKTWSPSDVGIHYYSNPTATITTEVFTDWVGKINLQMGEERRHILLLVTDTPAHRLHEVPLQDLRGFQGYKLPHLTLVFLSWSEGEIVSPLEVGIIQSFKCQYRKLFVAWMLEELDASSIAGSAAKVESMLLDMKQAIIFVQDAWQNMETELIRACWAKSGTVPKEWTADVVDPDEREKTRMQAQANELASLIVRLNFDTNAMPIQDYIEMPGEMTPEENVTPDEVAIVVRSEEGTAQEGEASTMTADSEEPVEVNDLPPRQISVEKAREFVEGLESFLANEGSPEEQLMIHQLRKKIRRLIVAKITKQKVSEDYFDRTDLFPDKSS